MSSKKPESQRACTSPVRFSTLKRWPGFSRRYERTSSRATRRLPTMSMAGDGEALGLLGGGRRQADRRARRGGAAAAPRRRMRRRAADAAPAVGAARPRAPSRTRSRRRDGRGRGGPAGGWRQAHVRRRRPPHAPCAAQRSTQSTAAKTASKERSHRGRGARPSSRGAQKSFARSARACVSVNRRMRRCAPTPPDERARGRRSAGTASMATGIGA